MKHFSLRFIQVAWVAETIAVILFSMAILFLLPPEKVGLWLQSLPTFAILIGAQGTAAGAGPLMADRLKSGAQGAHPPEEKGRGRP